MVVRTMCPPSSDMVEKANAAFGTLLDVAETLTAEQLAPVVIDLLKELELPEEAAELAFQRMLAPAGSMPVVWTEQADRGMFIVFEGLDRAGKSTQSRILRARLEDDYKQECGAEPEAGENVHWMCFPYRQTPLGSLIDLYLRRQVEMPDRAVHLLFSANRWEMAGAIVEELNAGRTVGAIATLSAAWFTQPPRAWMHLGAAPPMWESRCRI